MCGGVSSGASSVSASPSSKTANAANESSSSEKKGEKKVLVVFSSVDLPTLKKCGKTKTVVSDDNKSYSMERLLNVLEWEYYAPSLNFTPGANYYDHKIFVDCGDLTGVELARAYSGPKEVNLSKSELLRELDFALYQLKEYLLDQTKEYPQGGKVKLSICAIHPVECLLFAFQKILGCSVEGESVYLEFLDRVSKKPSLANAKDWLDMKGHKWEVELEYCGVYQLFSEEAVKWTPAGLKEKRMKEMERMRDELKKAANALIIAYKAWVIGHNNTYDSDKMMSLNEQHDKELKKWKDKGFILRPHWDSSVNPAAGGGYTYDEPYLEYEGRECRYQDFEEMIAQQIQEDHDAMMEAAKPENADKQKKEIDKTISEKKKEKNLALNDLNERDKAIDGKIAELHKRNTANSNESNSWEAQSVEIYDTSEEQKENKKLIEFEGDLLNEEQLKAKKAENAEERKRVSGEFWKWNDHLVKQKQDIDDLVKKVREAQEKEELDNVLSWVQFGIAVVGVALLVVVAAPVAAPIAAVAAGAATVTTAASVAIETYRWVAIDGGDKAGTHLLSIGLDLISFKCLPVFKMLGKSAAKEASNALKIEQNIVKSTITPPPVSNAVTNQNFLKQWITTLDSGEDAALSFMKKFNLKGTLKEVNPEDMKELSQMVKKAQKGKHDTRVKRTQDVRNKMQQISDDQAALAANEKYVDPKIGKLKLLDEQAAMLKTVGEENLWKSFGKAMVSPSTYFKSSKEFTKTSSRSEFLAKFLGCDSEINKINNALGKTSAVDAAGFYRNTTYLIYGGFDAIHYGVSIFYAGGMLYNRDDHPNPNLSK